MGRKRKNIRKLSTNEVIISVIIILAILGLQLIYQNMSHEENIIASYNNISEIPEYNGQIYVELNNNIPYFEEKEYTTESFERYSNLDNKTLSFCKYMQRNNAKRWGRTWRY